MLQTATEEVTVARHSIETLLKMDVEQCRMRYCFTEFKEVTPPKFPTNKKEMKNLMKSCIGVGIFIQTLLKQVSKDTSVFKDKTIIVESKYHPRFGAVKIVDRKFRASASS
jgi:hypothetical protein